MRKARKIQEKSLFPACHCSFWLADAFWCIMWVTEAWQEVTLLHIHLFQRMCQLRVSIERYGPAYWIPGAGYRLTNSEFSDSNPSSHTPILVRLTCFNALQLSDRNRTKAIIRFAPVSCKRRECWCPCSILDKTHFGTLTSALPHCSTLSKFWNGVRKQYKPVTMWPFKVAFVLGLIVKLKGVAVGGLKQLQTGARHLDWDICFVAQQHREATSRGHVSSTRKHTPSVISHHEAVIRTNNTIKETRRARWNILEICWTFCCLGKKGVAPGGNAGNMSHTKGQTICWVVNWMSSAHQQWKQSSSLKPDNWPMPYSIIVEVKKNDIQ